MHYRSEGLHEDVEDLSLPPRPAHMATRRRRVASGVCSSSLCWVPWPSNGWSLRH